MSRRPALWDHQGDPLRITWRNMKARCTNPKQKSWPNYGAKGIRVCDEWSGDFEAFKAWSLANGHEYGSGLTIDRIDNSRDYGPGNCKWSTTKEQNQHYGRNVMLTAFGITQCATLWEQDERSSVTAVTMSRRLKVYGWSHEDAITRPNPHAKYGSVCPEGHDLTIEENVYRSSSDNGNVRCAICRRARSRDYAARRKEDRS